MPDLGNYCCKSYQSRYCDIVHIRERAKGWSSNWAIALPIQKTVMTIVLYNESYSYGFCDPYQIVKSGQ